MLCLISGYSFAKKEPSASLNEQFEGLYRKFRDPVVCTATILCRDPDHAEDAVQEAFLKLRKALEATEVIHDPYNWLVRVARNLCLDRFKSRFHQTGQVGLVKTKHGKLSILDFHPDNGEPPTENLEREEQAAWVRKGLEHIPESDAQILHMAYFEGLKRGQIAARLGIGEDAASMRLTRARERLRAALASLTETWDPEAIFDTLGIESAED